jgi:hypothetical protein
MSVVNGPANTPRKWPSTAIAAANDRFDISPPSIVVRRNAMKKGLLQ